jgi:hypothetical protein
MPLISVMDGGKFQMASMEEPNNGHRLMQRAGIEMHFPD